MGQRIRETGEWDRASERRVNGTGHRETGECDRASERQVNGIPHPRDG